MTEKKRLETVFKKLQDEWDSNGGIPSDLPFSLDLSHRRKTASQK